MFIIAGACRKLSVQSRTARCSDDWFSRFIYNVFCIKHGNCVARGKWTNFTWLVLYVVLSIIGGLAAGILGFHLGGKKVRDMTYLDIINNWNRRIFWVLLFVIPFQKT